MSAIMQEYAITVKSADIGLPYEKHYRVKKNFEVRFVYYLKIVTGQIIRYIV